MSRKRSARQIPPLPIKPVFRKEDHKTECLLGLLRALAVSSQQAESQLFYPLREVALSFKVPVSLVAKVYRELEREGILKAIRSSRTILQGLNVRRQESVRGVIAILGSMSCFLTMQDYRTFLRQARRELRKRDFAAAEVFFAMGDTAGEVADRLKACHPDQVIWYCPGKFGKEIAERLGDIGVPIIGVSDGGWAAIQCQYQISRQPAITAIMREWKKEEIVSVVVASGAKRSATDEARIDLTLQDLDFHIKFVNLGSQSVEGFVESLEGGPNCGTVLLHSAASLLAMRVPEALAKLAQRRRIAFIDGPVSVPFARLSDILVDLVTMDWQAVAKRIVDDLLTQKVQNRYHPVVFEAVSICRVPLREYAEKF